MHRDALGAGSITFVAQNQTHAANFTYLARAMVESGIASERLRLIGLDQVTKLNTKGHTFPGQSIELDSECEVSFYRQSRIRRLVAVKRLSDELKSHAETSRLIVVGNDGALQRCMINHASKTGAVTALILDGLLFPHRGLNGRFLYWFRRLCQGAARVLRLDHYVPSLVGHGRLDCIYVMNPAVEDLLKSQGVTAPIWTGFLPRHIELLEAYELYRKELQDMPNRITYVTSAFAWHNRRRMHGLQLRDIADFRRAARSHPSQWFRIRIHPREDGSEYRAASWPKNVELTSGDVPLARDLAESRCIVTARSTVALEARMAGLPVFLYCNNFRPPDSKSPLSKAAGFEPIVDLSEAIDNGSHRKRQFKARVRSEDMRSETRRLAKRLLRLIDA